VTRSHWITVLKLALVAVLMIVVFRSITWRDTLVRLTGEGEDAVRVVLATGEIEGDWDVPEDRPLQFRRDLEGGGLGPVESVLRTADPEGPPGSRLEFEFGFLTFWRHLDIGWFLLGAACYGLTVFMAGARWWWLLKVNGLGVSLAEALRFTWIGVFFNNVVPGATGGDLVKAIYIMKRCPGQRVQSLVSVVVDRIMGLASLALLCGIAVLFMLEEFWQIAIGVWAVIFGVGLLGTLAFSKRLRRAIRLKELMEALPFSGVLKRVDEAVYYYRGHKVGLVGWLFFGMVNHMVSVASVLFMGIALGVGLDWPAYFVLVPVVNIASALPLGPNGWGVGEAVYGQLFASYGTASTEALRRTQGVSLSVLYRLHISIVSLVGGLVMLLEKDRVTRSDVAEQMAKEVEEETQKGF